MRLLVTGDAGYIGSIVADRLLMHGHAVTVLDSPSKGDKQVIPPNAEFVHADIAD